MDRFQEATGPLSDAQVEPLLQSTTDVDPDMNRVWRRGLNRPTRYESRHGFVWNRSPRASPGHADIRLLGAHDGFGRCAERVRRKPGQRVLFGVRELT